VTVYCWIDYSYYDGMLYFSQVWGRLDPYGPIQSAEVRWLNSEWRAEKIKGLPYR